MLAEGGYLGLNMDRIAAEMEYGKGTIYQHFRNKEEIIIALANETLCRRTEMFARAAAFRGRPRERMVALGVAYQLFVRLYPDHFDFEQIVGAPSIWEKTSPEGREKMQACKGRCIGIIDGVIRDAIAQGDLELPQPITPDDLRFGLWALTLGGYSIVASAPGDSLAEYGVRDPFATMDHISTMLLDGFGWQPLSSQHDYEETYRRVQKEVFSDEVHTAKTG
jgi:AcrR family transcriptional regulator